MIVVSRVLGESFDLATGREMGKSLVLTNGQEEVAVLVSDDDVRRILELALKPAMVQVPDRPTRDDEPDLGELQGDYRDAETGTDSI